MLFNSYGFLGLFLPIVLLGWWTIRGDRPRLAFLLVASYVFYATWDVRYLPILVLVTAINLGGGWMIDRDREHGRRWLTLVVALNLGVLAVLKYLGWLLDTTASLVDAAGIDRQIPALHILLPLGISFYVLNAMTYAIDVQRGRVAATRDVLRFAAFVALFPHLIAGPIVRYEEISGQLANLRRRLTGDLAYRGLLLLAIGLAKKLLIADSLAPHVDRLYASAPSLDVAGAWSAAFGYTLQLYFDFSAYSDMAIGLALLLGVRFPQNFDSPLKAVNISDFWRRWHMTLSRFMRDYVYIPLGGSRGSRRRTAINLGVTMFVAGLWHGAGATFIVWGLYHGFLLASHAVLRARRLLPSSLILGRAATTLAIILGFVVFRAPDLTTAGHVFAGMVGANAHSDASLFEPLVAVWIVALLAFVNIAPNAWNINDRLVARTSVVMATGVLLALAVASLSHPSPFLYFRF